MAWDRLVRLPVVDSVQAHRYNFSQANVNEVLTVATETGKRYFCGKCGAEFVVTRGSDEGNIQCCGEPLGKK